MTGDVVHESLDPIADILRTGLPITSVKVIDDAFIRRFNDIVKFTIPNEDERKEIWEKSFPKNADYSDIPDKVKKYELAQQVREDIRNFQKEKNLSRMVMIWCASTEVYHNKSAVHETIEAFEQGLKDNHDEIIIAVENIGK